MAGSMNLVDAQAENAAWSYKSNYEVLARPAARDLYESAARPHPLRTLLSLLKRRPLHLIDLAEATVGLKVRAQHYSGEHEVEIGLIRGSEGRTADFDSLFRPLRHHSKNRWTEVALAWELGIVLPPVELIKVGDIYFVRDGHHRISVALAHGLTHVTARVTEWEIERQPSGQPAAEPCMLTVPIGASS